MKWSNGKQTILEWNQTFSGVKDFLRNENIALHVGDQTVTNCNGLAKEFNEHSRKFYIRRNNNKVNSKETGRRVIASLIP